MIGARADFKATQSVEETNRRHCTFGSGSTIYGYDKDRDGKIDEIKEYWVWYGSHAAVLCERDYTSVDREFKELNEILIRGK